MIVVPGRWFRHNSSGKICQAEKVSAGWVDVTYWGSRQSRRYRIEQFVLAFESVPKPTKKRR